VKRLSAACSIVAAVVIPCAIANAAAAKPAALVVDGMPPIPDSIPVETRPYMEYRTARLTSWNPVDRSMLIKTRFGDTIGGNEFFQLYTLESGKLTLLTDGKSRNEFGA
jgi:hypothetical protein